MEGKFRKEFYYRRIGSLRERRQFCRVGLHLRNGVTSCEPTGFVYLFVCLYVYFKELKTETGLIYMEVGVDI